LAAFGEISRSATGYALGNLLTSLIAGVVVFVTLTVLGVPFPLLWALWVAWSIYLADDVLSGGPVLVSGIRYSADQ
jgi:predicted PurR-regulated permease PerM